MFAANSALAKSSKEARLTSGAYNGNYWTSIKDKEKLDYLSGFMDALNVVDSFNEDSKRLKLLKGGFTYGQIKDYADKFYSKKKNRPIPLAYVIFGFAPNALSGELSESAEDSVVDKMLEEMKSGSIQPQETSE